MNSTLINQYELDKKLIELGCNRTIQNDEYNQYRINSTYLKLNDDGVRTWNAIIDLLHQTSMHTIIRTKSGAIANNIRASLKNCYAYDIRKSSTRLSLTILYHEYTYNIVVGASKEQRPIDPQEAWKEWIKECEKDNINFFDYAITPEEGKLIAQEIRDNVKPYISMKYQMTKDSEPLTNVHHLDLHSSYPSGLVNMYPEFRNTIERIYNNRKLDNNLYKAILTFVISGCTMSRYNPWNYRWSHIAKYVREFNNSKINYLIMILEMSGREVIGLNTDGIWYRGEIYHGPGEGDNILEWSNDHTNCIFRSKSDGSYEFIENGKYEPVVRGSTNLDMVKPREEWTWGDIFEASIKEYKLDEESEKIHEIK